MSYTNNNGEAVEVKLRKLSPSQIGLALSSADQDLIAALFIKPDGRNPEEVREFYNTLESDAQADIYFQGWELNETNFEKFDELRKKQSKLSGRVDMTTMMSKILEDPEKLAQLTKHLNPSVEPSMTGAPDSSATGTD